MATQTQQNTQYYANLLVLQYLQKPKAYATIESTVLPALLPDANVQAIIFTAAPASGAFELQYNGINTASIAWNASAVTIQGDLNAILVSPLSVAVTGTIASGLTFTFSNINSTMFNLVVVSNTLVDVSSSPVIPSITSIGIQLPLEIQNAFNLLGSMPAVGFQLDILGKYAGVTRNGNGFNGPITLDDTDFLTFIQLAIIRNSAGSSLATIELLLNQFFPGQIFVFDYQNMQMSYLIDTAIGSQDLIDLFVTEGLLPRPMAVSLSAIAVPVINEFFAFRTYGGPAWVNTTPFNSYTSYNTSWLWLTYQDAV